MADRGIRGFAQTAGLILPLSDRARGIPLGHERVLTEWIGYGASAAGS
jgi:hypothetical protein